MKKLCSLERLEESFHKLPSVGKKSAERMAYAVLNMQEEDIKEFSEAILDIKNKIKVCPICGMISEDKCLFCNDNTHDQQTLMIVSEAKDVFAIENSEGYKGVYHVLNGEISPNKGKDIESLNIVSLLKRVEKNSFQEIIIATNPTIDGETTALYLSKLLSKYNVPLTRLAYGLQMGGNLDYTDQLTLLKALQGRRKI